MASSTNTAATTAPSEKSVELNSTASAANAAVSTSHAKIKQKEDAAQEASERRRIWAMAAASAAEMLKELTKKSAPEFDDVIQHFAPITPGEWAEKRKILEAMKDPAQDIEEITDAQVADELFYDPDVTDDDLGMFLGASDADLKDMYGGSADNMLKQKQRASKPEVSQRYSTVAAKDIEKSSEQVRGSQEQRASVSSHGSVNQPKKSSVVVLRAASHDTDAVPTDSTHTRPSELDVEHRADNIEAHKKGSMQTLNSNSADDLFFGYGEDENVDGENEDETAEDSEMEMYQPANVNINVNEALVGLEDLLEDLKMESRITDRFRYKTVNKYSLLLQALVTYQEREMEVISHLKTKKKILIALHQFVKQEAEAAAKAVITDEENKEEEKDDQMLDLMGKHGGEGGEDENKKDSQGLSIEEMPAATIRETLLQQKNRIDVLESIKKVHVLQLKQLEFERTLLNLHYARMVKPSDLSKEIKDGRRQVNDLQLEISSIHQEMGQVQNEIRIQEKLVIEEEKAVEKLELEALTKQGEVQVLANKPVHIAKEADREAQKLEQYQDTHDNLCMRYMDGMEVYRTNQVKVDILTTELNNLNKMEAKLVQQKKTASRDYDLLFNQMDSLMSREHIMLERATVLTDRMQQLLKQKKRILDEQHRMFNEANKSLREAQRLERSIRMAADAFLNAKLAYDKMRTAFDAAKPSDQTNNWEKLSRMLNREIFNLKGSLDKKLDEANYKSGMVTQLQEKLNELYEQQVASGKELQDLIRTTVRKRREREEKSEQCIKLESQIQRIALEKKTREIAINDCLRHEKIIFRQLSKMQKRFNQLKTEKSAIINELSAGRVKVQETRVKAENLKVKLNAYIAQMQLFESMIKEKYYVILNARIKRDTIKNDAMRSRTKFRFYRNQKFELLLNNKTLRREADKQKTESVQIRKEFEKATNTADEMAISYRVRTEEVCTFHEYIYCYQKILLRGSEGITIREMEKTKLRSLYEETRKHVFIVQMNQPDESAYFKKIEKLRTQFYEITEQRRELEAKLNDDDNPSRVREIDFEKLKEKENVEVLEKRLDLREENLATRDVIGLERTLMENHLTKITEDSLDQAIYLKDYYGDQVKAIVNIRKSLNNISQQIDGFICENAIASAQADIAEKHFHHCRQILQGAEERWVNGHPPTDEMEAEWKRTQWRNDLLGRAKANTNKKGFLRQVKPRNGTQIQANKWTCNKRKLEHPESSVLGWRFSAVSDPIVSHYSQIKFESKCMLGVSHSHEKKKNTKRTNK